MEPSTFTISSEPMRSEDDEECVLLRCQLAKDDGEDNSISTSHSPRDEEEVFDGHLGADSCPSAGYSSHTVTCIVSIALALPRGDRDDAVTTEKKGKKKTKKVLSDGLVEAPKPQSYYHIEYSLLPGTSEPIKVDLVMFGLAAKVYMEDQTKVLKPWLDGDRVWLGWSQSVKLKVSRELLVKIVSHKITFRVWDTKDRVSSKAKYDRPKAFRLPLNRNREDPNVTGSFKALNMNTHLEKFPEHCLIILKEMDNDFVNFLAVILSNLSTNVSQGGIKSLVDKLRAAYNKESPRTKNSKVKIQGESTSVDYKPLEPICAPADPKHSTVEVNKKPSSSVALSVGGSREQEAGQHSNQREEQHGVNEPQGIKKGILDQDKNLPELKCAHKRSLDHCTISQKDTATISTCYMKDSSVGMCRKDAAHQFILENTEEAEQICKYGVASVEFSAKYLLAGDQALIDRFWSRSESVCEGFCSITLDQPLMSEQLKAELNPLVITILSASSLPSSPVPFHELQEKCLPVYCQYKFHNMPMHKTRGQCHASDVYFRDVNVILTGLLSAEELLVSLRGPVIEIELHDRDRKTEKPLIRPAIFGTETDDDKLASTALTTTRRTSQNSKLHDPYGIAKLNLSDLLNGHTCLNLSLPIRCSHSKQWRGACESKPSEKSNVLDEPRDSSLPMGHYIEANSKLKIQVEIARQIVSDHGTSESHCPFGRIVYIFHYNNKAALTKLRSEVLRVNGAAFHLDSHTKESAQKVLSGHRMSAKERSNRNLNVLTGFHMLDKSLHLFVLEGLKEQAIRQLWETGPQKLDKAVEEQVIVLYNSGLSFSERLYDSLDVGLSPVYLHQPLDTILKEPSVYIRDALPYTCLQALLQMKHLCQVKKLEEVMLNDLFPSAKMVLSLKHEFGEVPTKSVEHLIVDTKDSQPSSYGSISPRNIQTPLDAFNKDYLKWKRTRADPGPYTKNFVRANIEEVQRASSGLQKPKPKVFVAEVNEGQSAHNYSIQKLNCTGLAHELLRKEMAKVPGRRFSYNQDYHSFTVDPVDVEAEQKALTAKSHAAWRTYDGFIYPGFKSSIESNRHPKQPDEARVEELRKPWRENILHRNKLSPTLSRSRWPWSQHHKDFELYVKPLAVSSHLVSIHLAGESLRQEQLQAAQAQYSKWLMKILPDKDSARSGRVPEFKCHTGRSGLDKLQDLLKDRPMKRSLMRAWKALK
ncbi:hypothetical protein NFI96_033378, partial [Prochilodus magdalenae]